jgi:hypothetical protein
MREAGVGSGLKMQDLNRSKQREREAKTLLLWIPVIFVAVPDSAFGNAQITMPWGITPFLGTITMPSRI